MQLTLPSLFFKHPFFLECSRRGGDFNRNCTEFSFFVMQNGNTIKNQSIRKRFCHFSFPSSSANSFLFPFWYEQMNCTNMLWFKREWNKFCHLWVTSAHFVFEKISLQTFWDILRSFYLIQIPYLFLLLWGKKREYLYRINVSVSVGLLCSWHRTVCIFCCDFFLFFGVVVVVVAFSQMVKTIINIESDWTKQMSYS